MEPQRVEAHRVRRIELAPAVVWKLVQQLEREVVALGEPTIDQLLRCPFRLRRADVGGLEDGSEKAFGRDRISADEVPVTVRYAAEILRPWLIQGHVEDHPTDLAGAQLLWLRRVPEKGIDFTFREQLHGGGARDPLDVPVRVDADLCRND